MKIVIIGGGLAGCAAAYVLKQAGLEPVIYEAAPELAAGASGNALGLYNPRLSAHYSPEAQYYDYGFQAARAVFAAFGHVVDYTPCGALHLATDEKKEKRFRQMLESWNRPAEEMRWCSAAEASEIAGVPLTHEALYLAASGYVSPRKLCAAYAQGVEVHLDARIDTLEGIKADAVILACAAAVRDFAPELSLQTIRGQVTYIKSQGKLAALKTCLCYGGYTAPGHEGAHMVGSTFQRWLNHTDILPEDDRANIEALAAAVPALAEEHEVTDRRAAIRTASRDQFPVVGLLPNHKNTYISTAHGSHGIISSLAAAQYLRDVILKQPPALSQEAIDSLNPARFM